MVHTGLLFTRLLTDHPVQGRSPRSPASQKDSRAECSIYDAEGRLVKTLSNGMIYGGQLKFIWDTKDARNKNVESGVYFVRLKTERTQDYIKLVIVK